MEAGNLRSPVMLAVCRLAQIVCSSISPFPAACAAHRSCRGSGWTAPTARFAGKCFPLSTGFNAASDIVQVVESVSPEGVSCPLYISVSQGGFEQTFWRFAPDDEPEGWFDEGGRRQGDAALATPRPGARMSSPFGPRRYYGRLSGGGFHNGIDYEAQIGQPIFAAADGIIEHRDGHFEYGLTVKIRHAAQFTTLYAHLSRFAGGLAVGSRVRKGQVIGYVGMTGRSTGAHLHFSTIVNDKFVDPAAYLSNNGNRSSERSGASRLSAVAGLRARRGEGQRRTAAPPSEAGDPSTGRRESERRCLLAWTSSQERATPPCAQTTQVGCTATLRRHRESIGSWCQTGSHEPRPLPAGCRYVDHRSAMAAAAHSDELRSVYAQWAQQPAEDRMFKSFLSPVRYRSSRYGVR